MLTGTDISKNAIESANLLFNIRDRKHQPECTRSNV